ncbi:MAG: DMT family transporter [Alphaproteobacteria bacterium]|nr:DMT family transporter [Alphaproteobacteria bacterium]
MTNVVQKIRFSSFSPNLKGACWLLGSVILFQISYSLVKLTGQNIPSVQIVFLRSLFQMLLVLPFVCKAGFGVMKTRQYKNYACRLFFGVSNIVLTFYAFTHMQLAGATSLVFTRSLFTIPLAAIMLKEHAGWKRGIATVIGFIGVLIVLNPGPVGIGKAETAALFASFLLALTYIYIQRLSRTENHSAMLMYFGMACCVLTVGPAYFLWVPVKPEVWLGVFAIAATATSAQYCIIRGYQIGKATVISPIDYLQIPLAAMIGRYLFGETLSLHFTVGVIIIITTSVYILKRRAGDDDIPATSTKEAIQ